MDKLTFSAVRARQSPSHTVVSFAAKASELQRIAAIERIGRDEAGALSGFQRPQIASHIREIKDYLEKPDSILPNPIVVAFIAGVSVDDEGEAGRCRLTIDVADGPRGWVVDGQQRLTALSQLEGKDFEVFVSAVVCTDEAELRRQFVLINNTRPLPKSLIHELLPTVGGLPARLAGRALAAELTARLNYDKDSSLKGLIHQHTNPDGVVSDTAVQRVIMRSAADGVIRDLMRRKEGLDRSFELVSEFYGAVRDVFPEAWETKRPLKHRLMHGASIAALGYVMEVLALLDGAREKAEFAKGLGCLVGRTAWRSGHWEFGDDDRRHWKAVNNVDRDIVKLAQHLIDIVKADLRARRAAPPSDLPLVAAAAG